jgi:hypothetical protein
VQAGDQIAALGGHYRREPFNITSGVSSGVLLDDFRAREATLSRNDYRTQWSSFQLVGVEIDEENSAARRLVQSLVGRRPCSPDRFTQGDKVSPGRRRLYVGRKVFSRFRNCLYRFHLRW